MKKTIAVTVIIFMLAAAVTGCAAQRETIAKMTEQPTVQTGVQTDAQTATPTPDPAKENNYLEAIALLDSKEYKKARAAFTELGEYKDSTQKVQEIEGVYAQKYTEAEKLLSDGKFAQAALAFGRIPDYKDSYERARSMFQQLKNNIAISNHGRMVFALKKDGTLYFSEKEFRKGEKYPRGNKQNPVNKWKNIVELSGGSMQILGVRSDGKLSLTGENYIINRVTMLAEKWKDVDTVYAGNAEYIVGLKKDGSVLHGDFTQSNKKITAWKDIVAVAAGTYCAFGLKSDGTVVSFVGTVPWDETKKDRVIDVSGWTNIVAIEAAGDHVVGLKSDGSIVIAGPLTQILERNHKDELAKFTDIVAISAEIAADYSYNVVGLKSDGTVVAAGTNTVGQCDVGDWTDIVAVRADSSLTVGLKSDGTVVATGDNGFGQCDAVEGWKNAATVPLKKK